MTSDSLPVPARYHRPRWACINASKTMKTGSRGVAIIKRYEKCRLVAYAATQNERRRGIWTLGWGRTHGIKPGDTCTQDQADQWLAEDLAYFEDGVERLVTVPLTHNKFDALVSLAYNIGLDEDSDDKAEGLGDSTLLKLVNRGEFALAAAEFPKWCRQGGEVLNGLVERRAMERALFELAA